MRPSERDEVRGVPEAVVVPADRRGRVDLEVEGDPALVLGGPRPDARVHDALLDVVAVRELRAVLDGDPHCCCCCAAMIIVARAAPTALPGRGWARRHA